MSSTSSCSLSESSRKAISLERLDDNDIFYILYEQTTQIMQKYTESVSIKVPPLTKQCVFFVLTHRKKAVKTCATCKQARCFFRTNTHRNKAVKLAKVWLLVYNQDKHWFCKNGDRLFGARQEWKPIEIIQLNFKQSFFTFGIGISSVSLAWVISADRLPLIKTLQSKLKWSNETLQASFFSSECSFSRSNKTDLSIYRTIIAWNRLFLNLLPVVVKQTPSAKFTSRVLHGIFFYICKKWNRIFIDTYLQNLLNMNICSRTAQFWFIEKFTRESNFIFYAQRNSHCRALKPKLNHNEMSLCGLLLFVFSKCCCFGPRWSCL